MIDPNDPCLSLLWERRERCGLTCTPLPLEEMRRWETAEGVLRHETGGFFSVVGLRGSISEAYSPDSPRIVEQPIIHQPEIGILGVLLRIRGGRSEFLLQAKAEPGNVGGVQLSPTVQATESNYMRLHGGSGTPHLDHFTRQGTWSVLSDGRQSEQGTRFLGKYNRNVTVLVEGEGPDPVSESWRWCDGLSLFRALGRDYCVNTDLRSVLASSDWSALCGGGVPFAAWEGLGGWGEALLRSWLAPEEAAVEPFPALVRGLESFREGIGLEVEVVPLHAMEGWRRGGGVVREPAPRRFEVTGFRVVAPDREVQAWDQPLVRDLAEGEVDLVAQRRKGVLHFLVTPSVEPGFREKAQYGPSRWKAPEIRFGDEAGAAAIGGGFLDELLSAGKAREQLRCRLSEEGGRFHRSASLYRVIEVDESVKLPLPPGGRFATLGQVRRLVSLQGFLTNEARSAVALLLYWLGGPN